MTTSALPVGRPEWWERLAIAARRTVGKHPVVFRRIRMVFIVAMWAFVPLALISAIFISQAAWMLGWLFSITVVVGILFLLARTKTISWRLMGGLMAAGGLLAPFIGIMSLEASMFWFFPPSDGAQSAIAPFFEEIGKLLPLALLVALAPGRVRRFAVVDWVLVGYACGAGFEIVEEAARASSYGSASLGLAFAIAEGRWLGPVVLLNPFDLGLLTSGNGHASGHPVWSALITGAIGIAIHIWRRSRGQALRRWLAVGLALLAVAWVISDHMLFNSTLTGKAEDAWGFVGIPWGSTLLWFVGGRGYLVPLLFFAVFVAALVIDVQRRREAEAVGGQLVDPPAVAERSAARLAWAAERQGFVGVLRRIAATAAIAWLQWSSDAGEALRAYRRRPDESRRSARVRGRVAVATAVSRRRLAMRLTTPDDSRRRFALVAAGIALVSTAIAVVAGIFFAGWIGPGVNLPDDSLLPWDYLGGYLFSLKMWWLGLPWWQQTLFGLMTTAIMFTATGGLASAFLWSGISSYAIAHGHDMYKFAGDPRKSIGDYILNTSPGSMLADAVELGLTVLPIRIGPKGNVGEVMTYVGGEMANLYVSQWRDQGITLNEAKAQLHAELGAMLDPSSPSYRPPASFDAGVLELPSHGEPRALPSTSSQDLVVGRPDLESSTAYEVPGRGTYYTDHNGEVTFVVEAPNGSIAPNIDNAKPGVTYVQNDGFAYGIDESGGMWVTAVRLP